MPGQNGLAMSPMMALLSPDQQQNMMQLQQRQAIGQAMLQQGMQPVDTSNAQVGGLAYRVSPLQGVAKLLQTYLGNKMAMDSLGQQGQLMGQVYGNAFGQDQQAPVAQSAPPVAASADSGGLTGPSAGMGGIQGTPSPQALGATLQQNSVATPTQTVSTPGTFSLPGYTAAQSKQLYMMAPEEYAKARMGFVTPTDATRMALAAHTDPVAANAAAQFKANYVPPVTGTGTFRDPHTMQPMAFNPDIPAGTTPLYDASHNVVAVQPIQGAQDAMKGNAAATAAGSAQSQLTEVFDPNANGGKGGMVRQTVSNVANAANGKSGGAAAALANGMPPTQDGTPNGAPMTPLQRSVMNTESFGNPNAVSPKGAVGSMQTMPETLKNPGFGVKPPQNNSPAEKQRVGVDFLKAMQNRYGNDSDAVAAYSMGPGTADKWIAGGRQWNQLPPETQNYVGKTLAQAQNYQSGSAGGAAPAGTFAAAPPMGAQADIEANVKGQVDTMQKSYQNLQTVRSGAPAALQDLGNMQNLASGKSSAIVGPGMASMAGLVSANAAEYEKSRDNLVTNLGSQLGINSDAAREMVYGSIPSYGAPKQAIANGLQTLQGQVQTRLLKAGYLTDAYTAGDAKAYNQKENQFDQNVTPAIANIVTQPAGPQRSAALAAAAKDPQVRARLEWAAQSGILK